MSIALLATGDEIIVGDILNTNARQIAHALHAEGLALGLHAVASDDEMVILECLNFLAARHNIIIITGGLGPTSDDKTRFALARFVDVPLVEHKEALRHIEQRLQSLHLTLTPGNKQQALFPESAELLANPNGTALGCYYQHDDKTFILLPGPPRECLPMFNELVLPKLQAQAFRDLELLRWRVFGVAEGIIAQQIDDALQHINCVTGYRFDTPYVECKVRCPARLVPQIRTIVEEIVRPHIICGAEKKASEIFLEKIRSQKMTIEISDEVTGGLLQTLIQRPENYAYLHFQPQQSTHASFHFKGLAEYWFNEPPSGSTTVHLDCHIAGKKHRETQQLPYRSALVTYAAAEWLCYRMTSLLNFE